MMLRCLSILIAVMPGLAVAEVDCAAAEVRFAQVLGDGKDDLFRSDLAASVAEVPTRWIFAVTALLGVALPVEQGTATPAQAALLLATDPLLDCWRHDPATATKDQISQMQGIDALFPADRRAALVDAAAKQED